MKTETYVLIAIAIIIIYFMFFAQKENYKNIFGEGDDDVTKRASEKGISFAKAKEEIDAENERARKTQSAIDNVRAALNMRTINNLNVQAERAQQKASQKQADALKQAIMNALMNAFKKR